MRWDNAKEEQSGEVEDIQRQFIIKDEFSEPYNQHQNPVEGGAIKWLKHAVHQLLDRVGAPDCLWELALNYLAYVHNHTYNPIIQMTPHQFRHGETPDISPLLQFSFYERVLFLDHEKNWPSSPERSGRRVGIAENVGDAMTFWILDDQSKQILARSVVRPYDDNYRVKWDHALTRQMTKEPTAHHGGDTWPGRQKINTALSNTED